MTLDSVYSQVSEVSYCLCCNGWAERNAGNVSIALDGVLELPSYLDNKIKLAKRYQSLGGCSLLISSSGSMFRDYAKLRFEGLKSLHIDQDGASYRKEEGFLGNPTSEFYSHLEIQQYLHKRHRMEKVVLHTHPTEIIALTHLLSRPALFLPEEKQEIFGSTEIVYNGDLLTCCLNRMMPEVQMFVPKGVGLVKGCEAGSEELALRSIEELGSHEVIIWHGHGVLAIAQTIWEAYDMLDILNKAAKIFLLSINRQLL